MEIYEKLFEVLKEEAGNAPDELLIDFEQAVLSSAINVFGDVTVYGCYFHWKQALVKQLGKKKLNSIFLSDAEFQACVQVVYVLAFAPVSKIVKA